MVKNLIKFFIAIGFLLSQFLGFAVGLLQLMRRKPYTTNTGCIRSLISKFGSKSSLETPELWQNIGSAN